MMTIRELEDFCILEREIYFINKERSGEARVVPMKISSITKLTLETRLAGKSDTTYANQLVIRDASGHEGYTADKDNIYSLDRLYIRRADALRDAEKINISRACGWW